MKAAELRELSRDELTVKLAGLRKDLFQLRMQHATNQLDNPLRIQTARRDIARVQTLLRQAELAGKA